MIPFNSSNNSINSNGTISNSNTSKFAGLLNQGATCYLNSVIQILFMTPEFRSALYSWELNIQTNDNINDTKEKLKHCIPYQLQKLFGFLQLERVKPSNTVDLTTSFGWTTSDVFQQQDVQELFRVLFDALEDSFKGTKLANIIDDLYAGEITDYIRCIDVEYESERVDKFLDFSLAIVSFTGKSLSSLDKCIRNYIKPEVLDGNNQYFVESMQRKVDAIKGIKFRKLPKILSIQLKRFVYDFTREVITQKKINDIVHFPMILNMNQYMSRISTNNVTEEEDFETFLQQEIINLRNRKSNGDDINKNQNESDDSDDENYEIPKLVDENGIASPDQIKDDISFSFQKKFDTCNISIEELEEFIKLKGPWVYELYGLLIHSGEIGGGHYYTYIKDLDSSNWYNFNDSSVTKIRDANIKDAEGKKIYRGFGSDSSFTYSNDNAYMLMYRKIELRNDQIQSNDKITSVYPSDDKIPHYIVDEVKRQQVELERMQREEEELRAKLLLNIKWKNTIYPINVKRYNLFSELLHTLWIELNLCKEPQFQDILDHSNCPFDRLRVVVFNANYKYNIPLDVFDYDTYKDFKLSDMSSVLSFSKSYILVLEAKQKNEVFDPFFNKGLNILWSLFDPISKTFQEQYISLPLASTLFDLKTRILKKLLTWCCPNIEEMKLFYFRKNTISSPCLDMLVEDNDQLTCQYKIFNGEKVYVTMIPYLNECISEVEIVIHSITIKYELAVSFSHLQEGLISNIHQFDNRKSVLELRHAIASDIIQSFHLVDNLRDDHIRIFVYQKHGRELLDDSKSIQSEGLQNSCSVYIRIGSIPPLNHFTINMFMYSPSSSQCLGKDSNQIYFLPLFMNKQSHVMYIDQQHESDIDSSMDMDQFISLPDDNTLPIADATMLLPDTSDIQATLSYSEIIPLIDLQSNIFCHDELTIAELKQCILSCQLKDTCGTSISNSMEASHIRLRELISSYSSKDFRLGSIYSNDDKLKDIFPTNAYSKNIAIQFLHQSEVMFEELRYHRSTSAHIRIKYLHRDNIRCELIQVLEKEVVIPRDMTISQVFQCLCHLHNSTIHLIEETNKHKQLRLTCDSIQLIVVKPYETMNVLGLSKLQTSSWMSYPTEVSSISVDEMQYDHDPCLIESDRLDSINDLGSYRNLKTLRHGDVIVYQQAISNSNSSSSTSLALDVIAIPIPMVEVCDSDTLTSNSNPSKFDSTNPSLVISPSTSSSSISPRSQGIKILNKRQD